MGCSVDYNDKLKFHFRPRRGWINDPNGLSYYKGYYHVFYQCAPDYEVHWKQDMHWGHARTKDFLVWEELPTALCPDEEYDREGCWSGTAIAKEGLLYLFYASIHRGVDGELVSTVSAAVSDDGVNFSKVADNPLIDHYPTDGGPDFRDPAVCRIGDEYYCVMATGNPESKTGRLLLYKSADLIKWNYIGILKEWKDCEYTECPSLVESDDGYLLGASVCPLNSARYYNLSKEKFENGRFFTEFSAEVDKGPDQYAGQIFRDDRGRNILITWVSGWQYQYPERCIGCMSCPREITYEDGVLRAYPVEELRPYLKDEDEAVVRTDNGFRIDRTGRDPVVYEGEIRDLKILRDGYVVEVFVNGGEEVYTAIL